MAKMSRAQQDAYWNSLFNAGETAPTMEAAAMTGKASRLGGLKKFAKRFGPELVGWMLLSKYLGNRNQKKMQDIQMGAAREQAALQTPENLYYQAALPQAQADEEQARQALIASMSGGVVGPSLPKGYRVI